MKKNFGLKINNKELAAWLFLAFDVDFDKVDRIIFMLNEDDLNEEHVVEKLKRDYVFITENVLVTEEVFISEYQYRYNEWVKKYSAFTKKEINYLKKMGVPKEVFDLDDANQGNQINSPERLAAKIKGYVKGQDHVIDTLSVPFFQHYLSKLGDYDLNFKVPSLIIGPTGVGKSQIIRRFCDVIGCKFFRINTSDVTPSSWRGLSIGQSIASQLGNPNEVSSLQYAVLVIHELDKVVTKNCRITTDASTDFSHDFQRDLMRLFETNHNLRVEYGIGCDGKPEIYEIPISKMLIVFDGCFNGLEDIVKKRLNVNVRKSVGFNTEVHQKIEKQEYLKHVTGEDLITFGLMPELVGRLSGNLCVANKLTSDAIYDIITSAKENVLQSHVDYCSKFFNTKIAFEEDALRYISDMACESGLGFRNVKTLLSSALNKFYYTLKPNQNSRVKKVVIDKKYIVEQLKSK